LTEPVPFGRYQLLNLLGKGGMARVYRGVLSGPMGFEKQVALKLIDKDYTADAKFLQALTNEARLGGQIHHRNVVEIYEFNSVDDNWYMAMEYVDGWTLDFVLDECRQRGQYLPPTVVLELMVEICTGLEYAHELKNKDGSPLNLVHRDLKPGNIILGRSADVKIMDFGIAKAESNLYKTTEADVVKGTPVYMSPEQVNAEPLDRRSDLFSLGSLLHELITLQVPFQGKSLGAVVAGILRADLTLPLQRVGERAPDFAPLVQGMLARSADGRPPSAAAVRDALEALRRNLPEGPSLRSWLAMVEPHLPAARAEGDFGNDGPPRGVVTLAGVDLVGQSGIGGQAPGVDKDATRKLDRSDAPPEEPRPKKKRKKKKGSPLPMVGGGLVLAAAIALGIFWVVWAGRTPPEPTPTPTPVAAAEPTAEPTVESTPAPVVESTPAPTATPARTPRPTPRVAQPTPVPTAEPTPVEVQGIGTVQLNSVPWSTATVNGKAVAALPLTMEMAAGSHVAVFSCKPPQCKELKEVEKFFEVQPGELTKVIVRIQQ
jgi:eukaryotic-like serine/threonine-protein kinase